ncbi:DUF2798 domain-containing protein [Denitromonas ohlonensis]|uniref:DUF2798 domain-containing protein n=2 Tax=Denitromonas TaxID=139331 RepID=A0A558CN83_9RHOO|nr:DUF2798 domain-containing protein [Denitromonas ohlonensis]TVT50236.1 MAG: DUF2798 domain-containing protein [Denitromonas halophila]TVO69266.1 DUF2798 domain-containing protein [Denitromonas ohlonensis]TVO77366.1 DUF2798 domain-containing protein [Denitromonas ohlonensis]TVT74907.1 MAG: DUF2798 domain-containing protein [Denitromonas halophila]TVT78011.1 MAG: DUF2798 domain-containing protein [Denitromonas halophila]
MIPAKFGSALFSLILSGLMSLMVSGIATFRATGFSPDFLGLWVGAWLTAWLFAFPAVMLVSPVARRMVGALVAKA